MRVSKKIGKFRKQIRRWLQTVLYQRFQNAVLSIIKLKALK
jgi:hypothetical protein